VFPTAFSITELNLRENPSCFVGLHILTTDSNAAFSREGLFGDE
jgi:hypothetical protein